MNIPSLVEALYRALQSFWRLICRHAQSVWNLVTLATAIAVAWGGWLSFGQQQVVLFVGPPGSSTARIGPGMVEEFARTRNANGVNYRASLEPTAGTLSIRERIALESSRIPLGFVEDGHASTLQSDSLRALLPMDWDYLFVLCRRKFLEENNLRSATTLFDVVAALGKSGPGRIFVGPEKSGTAEMARKVLDKFDNLREEQYTKGIGDWREMRVALKADEIDLAFYSGPIGSETLLELAGDGKAVVLGLGPVTDAIEQETGAKYIASYLPANLAVAHPDHKSTATNDRTPAAAPEKTVRPVDQAAEEPPVTPFCRSGLQTIASRRVLACLESLSAADAYPLGQVAVELLRDSGYEINLKADDLPYGSIRRGGIGLRMRAHDALEAMRLGKPPFVWRQVFTWPSWMQAVAGVFLSLIVLDLLRMLAGRLDAAAGPEPKSPSESTPTTTPPASAEFQTLHRLMEQSERSVDEKTHRDIARELPLWDDRLRDLRREIHRAATLTENERESLWKRYEILSFEVQSSLNWVGRPAARRRRSEAPASAPTPQEPAPPAE